MRPPKSSFRISPLRFQDDKAIVFILAAFASELESIAPADASAQARHSAIQQSSVLDIGDLPQIVEDPTSPLHCRREIRTLSELVSDSFRFHLKLGGNIVGKLGIWWPASGPCRRFLAEEEDLKLIPPDVGAVLVDYLLASLETDTE